MGLRRRHVFAMVLSLVTAACSYVFELPAGPALDPPVGSRPRDAGPDIEPPPTDADTRETSVPFCASRTAPSLFCADLDEAPTLASLGAVDVSPGSSIAVVASLSRSPPRALLVDVAAPRPTARITRTIGETPGGISYSFALLQSSWGMSAADVGSIDLVEGAVTCRIALTGEASTWSVTQSCSAGGLETARLASPSGQPYARSRWQRFVLALRFAPTKMVTLEIDGVRVVDVPALDPMTTTSAVSVGLGIDTVRSGSIVVFQDDVLVTSP